MHVRPYKAIRQLRKHVETPYDAAAGAVSLISLMGHAYLDQPDRPRRKPTRAGARRVIRTQFARRARLVALAHFHDEARKQDPGSVLCQKLLKRISKIGGLAAIANALPSHELVGKFESAQKDVKYVVSIVEYLLRSKAHPEAGIRSTIEDAKAFVWLEIGEYGITKIGQIWEDYKLAAPNLYALHLERSFQPSKIARVDEVVVWAASFVKSSRRLERFLGRAAFAMDVIKAVARDQRERDFIGITRLEPLLQPFSEQEKAIISSIDRFDLHYGRSFNSRLAS